MLLNHIYDFTLLLTGYFRVRWQFVTQVEKFCFFVLEIKCEAIHTLANCSTTEMYYHPLPKITVVSIFYKFNSFPIPHMRQLKIQLGKKHIHWEWKYEWGAVVHIWNPRSWEAKAGRLQYTEWARATVSSRLTWVRD